MKTILIVEDQPEMRENLATMLEMENYAVLTAKDGVDGLARAREEKPDLILCDVMMPRMDGYGLLQKLREDRTIAGTPFIFLTARGEQRDLRDGMNSGADDYLIKPVTAVDLLAALSARLARESDRPTLAFHPELNSPAPLVAAFDLTSEEAEVLLWLAQGKSNSEISSILRTPEHTVRKHLQNLFERIGVDNRSAAILRALEILADR